MIVPLPSKVSNGVVGTLRKGNYPTVLKGRTKILDISAKFKPPVNILPSDGRVRSTLIDPAIRQNLGPTRLFFWFSAAAT